MAGRGGARPPPPPPPPPSSRGGRAGGNPPPAWGAGWGTVFGAPAGGRRAGAARLSQELATALRSPELREKLAQQGSEPVGSTPGVFAAFLAAEIPRWAELVRLSGVSSD